MQSFLKKYLWLSLLIVIPTIAMKPKAEAEPDIERQLQEIIKGLSEVKVPEQQHGKAFYPQLDKEPGKTVAMQEVLERYLNPDNPLASSFRRKISNTINTFVIWVAYDSPSDPLSVAFSPNNRTLAFGAEDKYIRLFDVITQTKNLLKGHTKDVSAITFNSNGRMLASGSMDKTIKLWDMNTDKLISSLDCPSFVEAVVFNPNDTILAVALFDYSIMLWNLDTKKLLTTLTDHTGAVFSLSFSPDGKILASGSGDSTVKLWNMTNNSFITTLKGHTAAVRSVAFSPDGKILASGSMDKTIKLWDMKTKTLITTLTGHDGTVISVKFSPDGKILASGSWDKTIKLWNMITNTLITTLPARTHVISSIAFSPDGKTLAFCSGSALNLWDMRPLTEFPKFLKSLYADPKKFLLLNAIIDNFEKTKQPLDLYQPEAIELLEDLPVWLQKQLRDKKMVRVFTKVGDKK